ncbi:MAG: monomethylamine:corrinoid methyltransferase [Candidatus Thorarchaeota archaeon]|nr:MAG: monomethylamine:corrinoid methyltransferase [Candidatus Thorarchaeota archaeon]
MIPIIEITNRALDGKPILEKDYDIRVFSPRVKELTKEHGIVYDSETLVPSDDGLADSIFKAAIDLICDVGVYCKDTERIIAFDEKEVRTEIKTSFDHAVLGEGLEQRTLLPRKPESEELPWIFAGAGGVTVSDESIFMRLVESYARMIPIANAITTPCLLSVDGATIRAKSPLEIEGSIRTVKLGREALRRAGRPGLPIMNAIGTAESAIALASGLHPDFGLRKTDGYMIAELAELKTDLDLLNRAALLQSLNVPIAGIYGPIYGGFAGGAEGTAVTSTAFHIQGILTYGASWTLCFPIHIKYTSSSSPELIWLASAYAQAVSRNTKVPALYYNYTAAGPCTEMVLQEFAAEFIAAVSSGASIETGGVAKGKYFDYLTPIEPMFASEVAYAAAGLKRSDADEIVKKIVPNFVDKVPDPPRGKRFQDCCDPMTGKPSEECFEIYNRVKSEVADLGMEFLY